MSETTKKAGTQYDDLTTAYQTARGGKCIKIRVSSGASITVSRVSSSDLWTLTAHKQSEAIEGSRLWSNADAIDHARQLLREAMADDLDAMTAEDIRAAE